jgi:hypothetical protein
MIRVIQRSDGPGFPLEPLAERGVSREVRGQDLDGDRALESRVPRLVDLAHAAGAGGGDDFVGTEPGTRAFWRILQDVLPVRLRQRRRRPV